MPGGNWITSFPQLQACHVFPGCFTFTIFLGGVITKRLYSMVVTRCLAHFSALRVLVVDNLLRPICKLDVILITITYVKGLFKCPLNESVHVKYLEWCLAYTKFFSFLSLLPSLSLSPFASCSLLTQTPNHLCVCGKEEEPGLSITRLFQMERGKES